MNQSVEVSGMQAKTVVSSNLLIDDYTAKNEAPKAGQWATDDSTFTTALNQTITSSNVIVPMSTVDGINFFYVDPQNVKGNGDAKEENYIKYTDLATLQTKYSSAEAAYLDYHFILKAENTLDSAQKLALTTLKLKYSGAEDENKAFRVAVFSKVFTTATVNGAKTAPGLADSAKLFAPTGYEHHTSGQAVNAATTLAAVTYNAAGSGILETVNASDTKYYEVTVRLWLEGEDKTCTVDTFKGLASGNWALTVGFTLNADGAGAVSALTMEKTA